MGSKVLIVYYSSYGHVFALARAVEQGARKDPTNEVRFRRDRKSVV